MNCYLIGTVILTAAMLTGCDRESAASPAANAQRALADAADQAAVDTKAAADAKITADREAAADARIAADQAAADREAAADARIAAELSAAQATRAAADEAAAATKAVADTKIEADLKAATDTRIAAEAKIAAEASTAKATSLLAQLTQHIKDNKIELAERVLAQLDGMKGSLPAALREQIETARTALSARKEAPASLK